MGSVVVHQMSARLAELLDQKLGLRGTDLQRQLQRADRHLPRHLRPQAKLLADALQVADHPHLARQIDPQRVALAYDLCSRHLGERAAYSGWRGLAMQSLRSAAFGVLTVAAVFLAYVVWGGHL
jgi:hypothetical protein